MEPIRKSRMAQIVLVCILAITILVPGHNQGKSSSENQLLSQSKADLVVDLRKAITRIQQIERSSGTRESAGYQIFSPDQTGKLWRISRNVKLLVNLLNNGQFRGDDDLATADPMVHPYNTAQVRQAMDDLASNLPQQFLKNYRIFLVPASVSGVSGQGGAGFSLIYALPETFNPLESDLRVTLYHEFGHHLHLGLMPIETRNGQQLWEAYHRFRGGSWEAAGEANTGAWSRSSEENFAEDFRMVFGKDQPFFGDMALGDLRQSPGKAEIFKEFILKLKTEKAEAYRSPWIPEGFDFWYYQPVIIAAIWFVLFGLALGLRVKTLQANKCTMSYSSYIDAR